MLGDGPDAVGVGHRRAAVLLDDQGHGVGRYQCRLWGDPGKPVGSRRLVGTAKRERQKAGRQARLEAARGRASAAKRKRTCHPGRDPRSSLHRRGFRHQPARRARTTTTTVCRLAPPSQPAPTRPEPVRLQPAAPTARWPVRARPRRPPRRPSRRSPGNAITGDTPCPPADGSAERTTSFEKPPPMCIDPAKTYTAAVETNKGNFTIELDPKAAPKTVNNFVVLSLVPLLRRHHVPPDHHGLRHPVRRPEGRRHRRPRLRVRRRAARGGRVQARLTRDGELRAPNTNGSQFFIITGSQGTQLPPQYSLFGQVTDGPRHHDQHHRGHSRCPARTARRLSPCRSRRYDHRVASTGAARNRLRAGRRTAAPHELREAVEADLVAVEHDLHLAEAGGAPRAIATTDGRGLLVDRDDREQPPASSKVRRERSWLH